MFSMHSALQISEFEPFKVTIEPCTLFLSKKKFQFLRNDIVFKNAFHQVLIDNFEILVYKDIVKYLDMTDFAKAVSICKDLNETSCIVKYCIFDSNVLEIVSIKEFLEQDETYLIGTFLKFVKEDIGLSILQ